ncbi:MAG TPA: hypothetical protein VK806_14130 [Bacteroidia bacterium]|jgi:hypothetical protein|nr:hypothetical protein [Bacteroidia bacterium]
MTGIKVNKEIFRNAGICLIFSLILLQTGCTSIVPLKATYPPSYTYTTNLSKDKFWDKVITMLDTNGIVIKAIDKASGVIVSERYNFISRFTNEDGNGKLVNPKAWVVINFNNVGMTPTGSSYNIWGSFYIHATEVNGITKVSVSLINLSTNPVFTNNAAAQGNSVVITSTGVFEKAVGDLIIQ